MLLNDLRTDANAEVEGVWYEIGEGFRVRLGRLGNTKYQEYLLAQAKKNRHRRDTQNLDVMYRALAKFVLLGWQGLDEEVDGEVVEVPYSEEKAYELLSTVKDFREIIIEAANDRTLFQTKSLEEDAGN